MEVLTSERNQEYFEIGRLRVATGVGVDRWDMVILKELVDNALDAVEEVKNARVEVNVTDAVFAVTDNGPGLSKEDVDKIIDYNTYASSKNAYIAPTRGHLGNALLTLIGIPVAMEGEEIPLEIHTRGVRYQVSVEWIVGQAHVSYATIPSPTSETRLLVRTQRVDRDWEALERAVRAFTAFNPGVVFVYNGERLSV